MLDLISEICRFALYASLLTITAYTWLWPHCTGPDAHAVRTRAWRGASIAGFGSMTLLLKLAHAPAWTSNVPATGVALGIWLMVVDGLRPRTPTTKGTP